MSTVYDSDKDAYYITYLDNSGNLEIVTIFDLAYHRISIYELEDNFPSYKDKLSPKFDSPVYFGTEIDATNLRQLFIMKKLAN
jgi:hypothetical protein